jgi:hypothetical protein
LIRDVKPAIHRLFVRQGHDDARRLPRQSQMTNLWLSQTMNHNIMIRASHKPMLARNAVSGFCFMKGR